MDIKDFTTHMPGEWVLNTAGHRTFLPRSLPREVGWLGPMVGLVGEASVELGRLQGALQHEDGLSPGLLLRPLVHREATLSSRIEGTVAAEEDLALYEGGATDVEARVPDVRELHNYLTALEWGSKEVATAGITKAFVRRLHQLLMAGVRGGDDTPGQFRTKQVLIGGDGSYEKAKFVPPSALHVDPLIDDLLDFVASARAYPPVVRAALTHYQFETIHPFNDGNGRIGRLLISIQVLRDLGMELPALHMSAYFESDRRAYYDGLLNLSQTGDWSKWTTYFLKGVIAQARDTSQRLGELRNLRRSYQQKFQRARGSVLTGKAIDLLFRHPAVTARSVAQHLDVTPSAAQRHVDLLVSAGILSEITGRDYGRRYLATGIIRAAREG